MRRLAVWTTCSLLALGACGGSSKSETTPTATKPPAVSTTKPPTAPTTTPTTGVATTTTSPCPLPTGSIKPKSTPAAQPAALLTGVKMESADCRDNVTFDFEVHGAAPPSCTVSYQAGPFAADASGAPVAVAGSAFAVVRCSPAYGYDYETSRTTYTGPKRIAAKGASYVREVVELGDNEGVLTWVIGLDRKRLFFILPLGPPVRELVISFS